MRAREFINNLEESRRARASTRLPADNGRPRVLAALITVSNVERGKKDGDECAAELVTDGGSRDPLCQPCARARAHSRHRGTARIAPKQQSAKQQSAHTRHITRRDTIFRPEEIPEILMPLDLSNARPAPRGRRSKSR